MLWFVALLSHAHVFSEGSWPSLLFNKGTRPVWGFCSDPNRNVSIANQPEAWGVSFSVTTGLDMARSPTENLLPSYKAEDKHVTPQRIPASKQASKQAITPDCTTSHLTTLVSWEQCWRIQDLSVQKSRQVLYFPYAEMLYAGAPFSDIPAPLPEWHKRK